MSFAINYRFMQIYNTPQYLVAYATDASAYREMPQGVCFPETVEDIQELMHEAARRGTCVIPRAGGTSLAGQVVGNGIVADISRHWDKIVEVNVEER